MFGIGGGNNGGGGNNLFGGIMGLIDPMGLLSGGQQGGDQGGLQTLLNPAGALIGLIGGEVNKASADHATKSAQEASAAEWLTMFTQIDEHTQYAQRFSEQSYWGDLGEIATTEIPQNGVQTDGYSRLSAQEFKDAKALEAIATYFSYLDGDPWKGHTHKFDIKNLEACVLGQGNPPPELMAAARYLLERDDLRTLLTSLSATGDGSITADGIKKWLREKNGEMVSRRYSSSTPAGNSPPPPADPGNTRTGGGRDSANADFALRNESRAEALRRAAEAMAPKDGGPVDSVQDGRVRSRSSQSASLASAEQSFLERGGDRLNEMDARITELMDKGELSAKENFELQNLMQKRKELYDLMSNISKLFHEMSMTAINNIR
jgi:hypothetical protein